MFRYLAVSRLMQEIADRIFRNTESARAELDGFELAIPDPAVHGFGVDACPLRHFGYGEQVPGIPCARDGVCSLCNHLLFSRRLLGENQKAGSQSGLCKNTGSDREPAK